jgi:hypothetical protein
MLEMASRQHLGLDCTALLRQSEITNKTGGRQSDRKEMRVYLQQAVSA